MLRGTTSLITHMKVSILFRLFLAFFIVLSDIVYNVKYKEVKNAFTHSNSQKTCFQLERINNICNDIMCNEGKANK